jgi:hypothetical protein
MSAGAGPRFDVHVDDALLAEDLAHSSVSARSAITTMIDSVRRDGVPREWLRRCEREARDGTRLAGCVKFYIPQPAGQWGAVLLGDQRDGQPSSSSLPSASDTLGSLGARASTRSPTDDFMADRR